MADTVLASTSYSSFAITIDDTSPTIVYAPVGDTFSVPDLSAGWNPYFSDSGFATDPTIGQTGEGTSFHVTAADGASLGLRWNGTEVQLYGFFPTSLPAFPASISYSVSLDGVPTTNYGSSFSLDPDSPDNVLAAFTNLTNEEHFVELTVHNPTAMAHDSILLRFDRAIITSGLPTPPGQQSQSQALTTVTFPDELIAFRGQWSFTPQLLPGEDLSFHTSTNVGDCATVQFNGTAIALSGLTTPLSGSYNITLDDEPPRTFSARSSFNSSSPTVLFYITGLDPGRVHELSVVNLGASGNQRGSLLILGSVNVTTVVADSGSGATSVSAMTSPGVPRGTIVAISVAVCLVVIAAITFIALLWLRRRREARRKEGFIVNPNVSRRRFSFLTRPTQPDTEKGRPSGDRRSGTADADILDITGQKDDGDDDDLDDGHHLQPPGGVDRSTGQHTRHASQNSDGSYSVDLPELPGRGGTYATTPQGSASSPTQRYSTVPYSAATNPSMSQNQSPRSPKPKGPRDMRPVSHGKEGSRGILLREMYTTTADVPTDVHTNDAHPRISGIDMLPQPQVSPLRVNFEDEPSEEAERRREGRHRSGASGISLPYSLKQALWGHIRSPPETITPEVTLTDADGSQLPAYSFLDMESTISASASTTSRNTRQSRSTSTRSSSKSRFGRGGSESSSHIEAPPLPQDPRVSLGLSMTMAGGPTSSQPSNSPDISLHAVRLSPLTIPDQPQPHRDVPSTIQPSLPSEYQPSPTDSIPFTVSDIHFRHSLQSTMSHVPDSRRTSHRVSNAPRPPHPPLPASPPPAPPEERPYIVQKLLGLRTGSAPSTPYGSPTVSGFGVPGLRWSRGRGSMAGPSNRTRT